MQSFLLVQFTRIKTSASYTIAAFGSAFQWELDPIRSLTCQLAVDKFNLSPFVFDQLVGVSNDEKAVAGYINRLLASLAGDDSDQVLTKDLRSYPTRRGSAVKASSSSDINLSEVAHRGRWTIDGFATVFECLAETSSWDQKVARSLGGWTGPKVPVCHPHMPTTVPANVPRMLSGNYQERLRKRSFFTP